MPTPIGGTTNNSTSGVTTLTGTYSPTNGNLVIVFFDTGGAITALTVKDNNNVALTAGTTQGNLASFYYYAGAGVTSFTAAWTTSQQAGIAIEEYSGVGAVNAAFSTNHASGSSGTDTITIPVVKSGNWIVCGLSSANTITGTVGNQRQQITASTARITLMDNSSGTSVTCTGTLTSAAWQAVGFELGGVGAARNAQDLALVVLNPNVGARVSQETELVIKASTILNVRVAQEVLLVIIPTGLPVAGPNYCHGSLFGFDF